MVENIKPHGNKCSIDCPHHIPSERNGHCSLTGKDVITELSSIESLCVPYTDLKTKEYEILKSEENQRQNRISFLTEHIHIKDEDILKAERELTRHNETAEMKIRRMEIDRNRTIAELAKLKEEDEKSK